MQRHLQALNLLFIFINETQEKFYFPMSALTEFTVFKKEYEWIQNLMAAIHKYSPGEGVRVGKSSCH